VDQSDAPDSFLTVAEVAGILKLNQQTVRNWIDQGSLPALRVGRRVRQARMPKGARDRRYRWQ
jgi:excisionase family DNA binding protein